MKKICPYCGRAGELGTDCEGCGYVLQESDRNVSEAERSAEPVIRQEREADRGGAGSGPKPKPSVGRCLRNVTLYVISVPAALFGIACFASIFVVGRSYHYTLGDNLVMFFLGLFSVALAGRLQLAARMVSRQDRRKRILNVAMAVSFLCIVVVTFLFA